jgi:hypothetical protein
MSTISGRLLHPEYFRPPFGKDLKDALLGQVADFACNRLPDNPPTPDISAVVQSCNDTPGQLHRLFDDLDEQRYPAGSVQRIVVSAGNSPETLRAAEDRQAIVREIPFRHGFRAHKLNEGLDTADNGLVYTTVGHAALSNDLVLDAAVHHVGQEDGVAAYGTVLPDELASLSERLGAQLLGTYDILRDGPVVPAKHGMGLLAADSSMVKRSEVGLYDHRFGAGGADGQMGKLLLRTDVGRKLGGHPYRLTREPVMAVHHTHGFDPVSSLWQYAMWLRMAKPRKYRPAEWAWHPNGGL